MPGEINDQQNDQEKKISSNPGEGFQNQSCPNQTLEQESWFTDLFDLRVVVFLVCVVVIAMTVTVLMLPRGDDESASIKTTLDEQRATGAASNQGNQSGDAKVNLAPSKGADFDAIASSKPVIEQAADGSFVLPIGSAVVTDCESTVTGITNWRSQGSAEWRLEIRERRTGFFHCYVTYQAKFESQFAMKLGDRQPLGFTVYPKEADFTEQFIVRLGKPDKPSLRLIANQVDRVSGVRITKIRLVPR